MKTQASSQSASSFIPYRFFLPKAFEFLSYEAQSSHFKFTHFKGPAITNFLPIARYSPIARCFVIKSSQLKILLFFSQIFPPSIKFQSLKKEKALLSTAFSLLATSSANSIQLRACKELNSPQILKGSKAIPLLHRPFNFRSLQILPTP